MLLQFPLNNNNDTEEQNTIMEHANTTEATGTITEKSTGKGTRTVRSLLERVRVLKRKHMLRQS